MRHRAPRIVEVVADLCVYAPIGFLLEAPHLVPKLVATGRERLHRPRSEPEPETRRYGRGRGPSSGRRAVRPFARVERPEADANAVSEARQAAAGESAPPETGAPAVGRPVVEPAAAPVETPASTDEPAPEASGADAAAAGGGELPIPGYDQLAASQVVARLADLDPADLLVVEAYEMDHRQRRTILNRIAHLRGA